MFTHDQVVSFCAVYERGSYSAGARFLERDRTTIREHISIMEDHIGVALFQIQGRSALATETAHKLYPRAKVLVRQLKALCQEALGSFEQELASASILYAPMVPPALLVYLENFRQERLPDLRIHWLQRSREATLAALDSGEAHLAVMPVKGDAYQEQSLSFTNLGLVRCAIYVGHNSPLLQKSPISLSDLQLHKQYIIEDQLRSGLTGTRIAPHYSLVTDNVTLLSLLRHSGWAHLPQTLAEPWIERGEIVKIDVTELVNTLNYSLCLFHSPAMEQHPVIGQLRHGIMTYARGSLV